MTQQIHRAYMTELDLNKRQHATLESYAELARVVWNWALARRITLYRDQRASTSAYAQQREFNAIKRADFPQALEASKCVPQFALQNLHQAYRHFFRRVRNHEKPGFPNFKSRDETVPSFAVAGCIRIEPRRIKLPRIGWLRLKEADYLPRASAHILRATCSRQAGRWFVALQVVEEIETQAATGPPVGVDVGINCLAVCSDGRRYENPRSFRSQERRLARLQKRLARQRKGSKRRDATKARICGVHWRIAKLRRDSTHKATSDIVGRRATPADRPHAIIIEDLNVAGMVKNRHLAQAVSDANMAELHRQLAYKTLWCGEDLIKADRFFPSTKTCSHCGQIAAAVPLSQRVFACASCGTVMDRDENASRNLAGLASVSPGPEVPGQAKRTWRGRKTCQHGGGPR
jgi:putative transposase